MNQYRDFSKKIDIASYSYDYKKNLVNLDFIKVAIWNYNIIGDGKKSIRNIIEWIDIFIEENSVNNYLKLLEEIIVPELIFSENEIYMPMIKNRYLYRRYWGIIIDNNCIRYENSNMATKSLKNQDLLMQVTYPHNIYEYYRLWKESNACAYEHIITGVFEKGKVYKKEREKAKSLSKEEYGRLLSIVSSTPKKIKKDENLIKISNEKFSHITIDDFLRIESILCDDSGEDKLIYLHLLAHRAEYFANQCDGVIEYILAKYKKILLPEFFRFVQDMDVYGQNYQEILRDDYFDECSNIANNFLKIMIIYGDVMMLDNVKYIYLILCCTNFSLFETFLEKFGNFDKILKMTINSPPICFIDIFVSDSRMMSWVHNVVGYEKEVKFSRKSVNMEFCYITTGTKNN